MGDIMTQSDSIDRSNTLP